MRAALVDLLEVSYHGSSTTNCFPAFDGNGNVAALVNAADGTVVANYEYGPFGEVIRANRAHGQGEPHPVLHQVSRMMKRDLLYYGYRYYKPSTGTWLSRDTITEEGFLKAMSVPVDVDTSDYGCNLYYFTRNNPTTKTDVLGLSDVNAPPNIMDTPFGCANACAEAKRRGMDHGDTGGVVCCGGKPQACVWREPITPNTNGGSKSKGNDR